MTLYQGILARDYPLIQGQLLIMTITMLSFNFLAGRAYASWIPVCVQEANKMRMPTILKILLATRRRPSASPS